MKELQKRGVEQFLEAEMNEHLGYERAKLVRTTTPEMGIRPRR